MKVRSPTLGIVSLVGASGGRSFLPAEAAAVSAIRGRGRTGVEDRRNVKEGQQQKVHHIILENDDKGGEEGDGRRQRRIIHQGLQPLQG